MQNKTAASISADQALPGHLREFDDVDRTRKMIYDNTLSALQKRFPMSDGQYRLELGNVRYSGPQEFSLAQQKRALLTDRTLKTPVTGTWRLVDEATGVPIAEKDDVVMHVPYYTQRGTFVWNGNDYTINNQSRLKAGVYTRTRASGEHEAHYNVKPGTGPGFRIWMEPSTGIFRVNIGQANIPAYPFFKTLGVEDAAMKAAWGEDVYRANMDKTDNKALDKLYDRFAGMSRDPLADGEAKAAWLKENVHKAELDDWVTAKTMGMREKHLTPALMLRSTQKLLNISRGDEFPDDRDDPKYSNVLSVEDFVKERIEKDAGKAARNVLWKAKRDRGLDRIPRGALNAYTNSLMMGSGLASPLEETNPVNIMDQLHRIIKLGEGGIPSAESVTDEARDVNPGQAGFIDLIAGPECYDPETEMLTGRGWIGVAEVEENDAVAGLDSAGMVVYGLPERVHKYLYAGTMYRCSGEIDFCVTPNHDMVVADLDRVMDKRKICDVASKGFAVLAGRGPEPGLEVVRVPARAARAGRYSGTVHCVTVPGGVVCVRRNGCRPFWCGNSEKIGIDVRAAYGSYKGDDQQIHGEFNDLRAGKKAYLRPEDMDNRTLAFPGQDLKADKVAALRDGKFIWADPAELDYEIPSVSHMYNATINMQPMVTSLMPTRAFYAAKYWSQFMPMVKGETPLVQTLMPGRDMTFNEYYGKKTGTLTSPVDGVVTRVSDGGVSIVTEDGKKSVIELAKDFPLNRLTAMSFYPMVKAGDVVKAGDSVAHSNFVDKDSGAFNMGVNLKTAVVPYLAYSYDDAYVISESAAKRLTNERLFGIDKDRRNGTEVSRNRYISAFPNKYTREQLEKIDSDGIVKAGTVVNKGDPVILATGPRLLSSEDAELGNLHKLLRNSFRDESVTWDYNDPGTVADVALTARGAKVNIKSQSAVQLGDKLVNMQASKGVVGCYDDTCDVFTARGWIRFSALTTEDLVLHRMPEDTVARFGKPDKLIAVPYEGDMIGYTDKCMDWLVTPNHRMWTRIEHYRGKKAEYRYRSAEDVNGHQQYHQLTSSVMTPRTCAETVIITDGPAKSKGQQCLREFKLDLFAELLGWWLAEGSLASYSGVSVGKSKSDVTSYKIQIAQSRTANPDNCARIAWLLDSLGISWWYTKSNQFTFSNKGLHAYFSQFGLCHEKYIPEYAFATWGTDALRCLWFGLIGGDGSVRINKNGSEAESYHTQSEQLAKDVDRLAALIGKNAYYRISAKAGTSRRHYDKWSVYCCGKSESSCRDEGYYVKQYSGMVYCVDFGGALIYVRRNRRAFWCGNCIVPDDEMPRDAATGEPFEMLLNPMVALSRVAPSQLMELPLGKIAKKTGKPYRLPAEAPEEGWDEFTRKELEKHGLKDETDLYDPVKGKTIGSVGDGYMYVSAFHHLAEKKLCLTTDTEVETAEGWKPIDKVCAEDRIVTRSPKTGARELQHPVNINMYRVDGEQLVHVETEDQDLVGTMDHDFFFERLKILGGMVCNVKMDGDLLLTYQGLDAP